MEYEVVLVNSGKFGKRVCKEIEKLSAGKTLLVDRAGRRSNEVAKRWIHAGASLISRQSCYKDYGILGDVREVEWKRVLKSVQNGLGDKFNEIFDEVALSETREGSKREKRSEKIKSAKDPMWWKEILDRESSRGSKWRKLVLFNEETEKQHVHLDNLYVEMLKMEALPKRWAIEGSSYKAAEAASILSDVGCQVYLITKEKRILEEEEKNIQENITASLLEKGVVIYTESKIVANTQHGSAVEILLKEREEFEHRIKEIQRHITEPEYGIDKRCEENVEVFRVESCERKSGVSESELVYLLTQKKIEDIRVFLAEPRFIYTNPPAASVGYTESLLSGIRGDIRTVSSKFRGLFYSVLQKKSATEYKMVVKKRTEEFVEEERVVGVHLFGNSSFDTIKGFSIAVHVGISPEELVRVIPIHPTSSEEVLMQ